MVVYGLYEVSIFLVARVERQREEKLRAEGYYDENDEDTDGSDDEDLFDDEEDQEDLDESKNG